MNLPIRKKIEQEALNTVLKNFEQNNASKFEMEIIIRHYNAYFKKAILQEKTNYNIRENPKK